MSSAAGAANRAVRLDRGMPFPLSDLAEADVVVLVGSNPADTMPPAMQYFDAGARRAPSTSSSTPGAPRPPATPALHLQPLPGTDLALANGLLHIALAEGLVDEGLRRRSHDGLRGGAGGAAATGPTASSGSPVFRSPTSGAPSSRSPGPRRRSS
jgi:assimilatory nitrate reductase catalytic subunit